MSSKFFAPILSAILLAAPYLDPRFFPLAWLSFIPLFWALNHATTARRAVIFGWLMGFAAHLFGFYWLVYTISAFGGFPYAVSVLVFILYAALQAIQMALFALLLRVAGFGPCKFSRHCFGCRWSFCSRSCFPGISPTRKRPYLWFIQTADLVGPYGVGFVVVWCNAAVFSLERAEEEGRKRDCCRSPTPHWRLLHPGLWGRATSEYWRRNGRGAEILGRVVQGNVDIDMKWNPALAQKNLAKHRQLTAQSVQSRW